MEIDYKNTSTIRFVDIAQGDIFECQGILYLKIRPLQSFNKRDISTLFTALQLNNQQLVSLEKDAPVYLKHGTLIVT